MAQHVGIRDAEPGIQLSIDLAARTRVLIQHRYACPSPGRLDGSSQASRSRPQDEQFGLFQRSPSNLPSPSCVSTRHPGVASVWQALVLGTPFMIIAHS